MLKLIELEFKFVDILCIVWVGDDAVNRADSNALRFIKVSNTLCASVRIYDIDRIVLFDRFIGALFSACVACDTFISDFQCQNCILILIFIGVITHQSLCKAYDLFKSRAKKDSDYFGEKRAEQASCRKGSGDFFGKAEAVSASTNRLYSGNIERFIHLLTDLIDRYLDDIGGDQFRFFPDGIE